VDAGRQPWSSHSSANAQPANEIAWLSTYIASFVTDESWQSGRIGITWMAFAVFVSDNVLAGRHEPFEISDSHLNASMRSAVQGCRLRR